MVVLSLKLVSCDFNSKIFKPKQYKTEIKKNDQYLFPLKTDIFKTKKYDTKLIQLMVDGVSAELCYM